MSRSNSARQPAFVRAAAAAALAFAVSVPISRSIAQPVDEPVPTTDAVIEEYLSDRALLDVLGAHLRRRLNESAGDERVPIAERLGRLYVQRLGSASNPSEREEIEKQSRELLKAVPDADSYELRIDLAKASYLRAEEAAENDRLRLATPDQKVDAERALRSVLPMFQEIANKISRRVEALERREQSGKDDEKTRDELNDARRVRSLAMYYSGWTNYYLAYLTGNATNAAHAVEDFGVILNAAPGKAASLDRLPKALLKYEHVARAVVGCALTASLRSNGDAEALRWLDAINAEESVPKEVVDQLFSRRIIVLGAAKRWADLDLLVRRRLRPPAQGVAAPLTPIEARLLAVITLDAIKDTKSGVKTSEILETLSQVALGELVTQGQIGEVLNLVQLYGTAPIGQDGFVVRYVQGMQAFERVRADLKASSGADDPTTDAATAQRFRDAASTLMLAADSADAAKFENERLNAQTMRAHALYYAGDVQKAAELFQKAADAAKDPKRREDALWHAIVALDRAVDSGARAMVSDRDRLATLFLASFPKSENSARLLLRRAGAGLLGDETTIKILSEVSADSPLYPVARRQIAEIDFRAFRRAPALERSASGGRFLDAADDALKLAMRDVLTAPAVPPPDMVQAALRTARQIAEVALAILPPDAARAQSALDAIDQLTSVARLDTSSIDDELAYRRLQLALDRKQPDQAEPLVQRLRAAGGPFADAADRLIFKAVADAWRADPANQDAAAAVTKHGLRLAEKLSVKPNAAEDPSVQAVYNDVAEASASIWRTSKNTAARDAAIRLDRKLAASSAPPAVALRRLAELSEDAGDTTTALDAWSRLLAGLPADKPAWFEARYQSIRLLSATDPAAAAEAMRQHKVLNPDFGPAPWADKLRDLDSKLPAPPPAADPAGAPSPPSSQPGGGR